MGRSVPTIAPVTSQRNCTFAGVQEALVQLMIFVSRNGVGELHPDVPGPPQGFATSFLGKIF